MDETGFSRDNEIIDSQGTGIVGSSAINSNNLSKSFKPTNVSQQAQGGGDLMSSLLM